MSMLRVAQSRESQRVSIPGRPISKRAIFTSSISILGGGGVVGFLKNVENTFFALLVYSLQPVFRINVHLQEYM